SIDVESWCRCIDGALTQDNYIKSMREAGFKNIETLDEKSYLELESQEQNPEDSKRTITSLTIMATKD
ncbi:MAG TPA: hypothetical protein VIY08_14535, partial [Candidatus Nitrosocosmicus sp.]